MTHDAKPHMRYTTTDLAKNTLIRAAAFAQEPVEHVRLATHYAWTHTKQRGWEFIPFV
jgi:hypothetical protein